MSTSIHIKVEADMKKKAQQTAEELGLSLSAVMKGMLKQFVRTKKFSVGIDEPPYGSDAWWEWSDKEALEDIKNGRYTTIRDKKELKAHLDSLKKS